MVEGSESIENAPSCLKSERRFVSSVFTLLGVSSLLPWNAFVSAEPYFISRVCIATQEANSSHVDGDNMELYFGLIFNFTSLCALITLMLLQQCGGQRDSRSRNADQQYALLDLDQPSVERSIRGNQSCCNQTHHGFMVIGPLLLYLLVFLGSSLLIFLSNVPADTFLRLNFLMVGFCGASSSIFGAGVLSFAGLFPVYLGVNPYVSGQAMGGLLVSLSNLISAMFEDPTRFWESTCKNIDTQSHLLVTTCPVFAIDWAAFGYFSTGALVTILCIVGYITLERGHHGNGTLLENIPTDTEQIFLPSLDSEGFAAMRMPPVNLDEATHPEMDGSIYIWNLIKGPATALFFTLVGTLTVFPAWVARLQSINMCESRYRIRNDLFLPFMFVLFNAFDFAGRLSTRTATQGVTSSHLSTKLILASVGRGVFFFLFFFCKATDSVFAAFPSDLFSMLVMSLFAFTNGVLLALSFMHASSLTPNPQMQEKASTIMMLALGSGLICGSLLSFPYTRVGTGHW